MAAPRKATQWCDGVATALSRSVCGARIRLSASRPTSATSVAIQQEHNGWRAKEERRWSAQPIVRRHVRCAESPQGGADSIFVSGSHAGTVGTSRAHSSDAATRGGDVELRRAAFVR